VAHLYGLSEPPLTHIFATFHEGWDYAERLKAMLKQPRLGEKTMKRASEKERCQS
jgi:hypothetical protein